jgi:hypothetical protein
MKNAFVTFYHRYTIPNIVELYNGFSFVRHVMEGDDFYVTYDTNIEDLREKLSSYDKIYYSVSFSRHIEIVRRIVDKRWCFGGPIFSPPNHHIKEIETLNFINGYFDDYLGCNADFFTPYWTDDFLGKITSLKYNANCGTTCYWKRCKFCNDMYSKTNRDRDVEKVFGKIKEYEYPTSVYLYNGSVNPIFLKKIIKLQDENPKENILLRVQLRPDAHINDVLYEAKNLKGLHFIIGLENFSQTILNKLDKGISIKRAIEVAGNCIDKGARVTFNLISKAPGMDLKTFDECLENIDHAKKFLKPLTKNDMLSGNVKSGVVFMDSVNLNWQSESMASEWGEYVIAPHNVLDYGKGYNIYSVLSNEQHFLCEEVIRLLSEQGFTIMSLNNIIGKN